MKIKYDDPPKEIDIEKLEIGTILEGRVGSTNSFWMVIANRQDLTTKVFLNLYSDLCEYATYNFIKDWRIVDAELVITPK